MVFLLLVAFAILFGAFRARSFTWRDAVIEAALWWTVFLVIATEVLSLAHLVTPLPVAIAWIVFCVACALWLRQIRWHPNAAGGAARPDKEQLSRAEIVVLCGAAAIVLMVGVAALISPPNTGDAMDYHLPRVVEWMSNRSVGFFPAAYYPQLIHAPGAEFVLLHFYLLAGGDRFANLVEWFSFAGCGVGVSLIAKALGASRRGQIVATIACLTIPEAVLESSGAMNTAVEAFWLVVTVYFLFEWQRRQMLGYAVRAGLALALAILTKETAYLFAPAFLLYAWVRMPKPVRLRMLAHASLVALLGVSLSVPHYIGNYRLTGSPIGYLTPNGNASDAWVCQRMSIPKAASNVLRNFSLHLGTPSDRINALTLHAVSNVIRAIGSEPDDPDTVWGTGFRIPRMSRHEILAGNPVHLFLLLLTAVVLIVKRRTYQSGILLFGMALALSGLIFCAALKWQVYGSRYQLPLFVLGSVLIGVVCSRGRLARFSLAICCLLLLQALPFAAANELRPLVGQGNIFARSRDDLYFADQSEHLRSSFTAAAGCVRETGCPDVAVDISLEHFNYPLLALLTRGRPDLRIRYTGFSNPTTRFDRSRTLPCATVCLGCAYVPEKWCEYRGANRAASIFGNITVFFAQGSQPIPISACSALDAPPRLIAAVLAEDYRALRAIDLGPAFEAVKAGAAKQPSRRQSLWDGYDELVVARFSAKTIWSDVEGSVRQALAGDETHLDRRQLLSAQQAISHEKANLALRIKELKKKATDPAQ